MHKIFYFIMGLFCFLYFPCAHALQIKAAKDNQTMLFNISQKEYSRIFVTNDRILSIKGSKNSYEIKEFKSPFDEGVLYIRPITPFFNKPFSLFITTEQGHHFTLFLTSIDVPAENIEIKPLSSSKTIASKWEENLPYTQAIIQLIKAMANNNQPEGYAVINMAKEKSIKLDNGLSMRWVTLYKGGLLQGEIWQLKNNTKRRLYLNPREFYQKNVRATSLLDETLEPGEMTILYRIMSHE